MTERDLIQRGIELIAVSFIDNAGIARAKSIPASQAEAAARNGVGASTSFAVFQGDDGMATSTGTEAVGDTRLVPDLRRVAGGIDGWGWAPADLHDQEGGPWAICSRTFLQRMVASLDAAGLSMRMAFEHEWYAERADGSPVHSTPAYGLAATAEAAAYLRAIVTRLAAFGVDLVQIHPEYSPGQVEVSVAAGDPLAAADDCVAARHAIRSAWATTGVRASFAPLVNAEALGNGCHLHFSLWRGGANLMGAADEPPGFAPEARAFVAGVVAELPALAGLAGACPLSYRRLAPNRWTGAFACWGEENREAPVRVIRGSRSARPAGANTEVKLLDPSANPYLAAGAVIAAGLAGIEQRLQLPEPVQIEPSRVAERLGLAPLPQSLTEGADALEASTVLAEALGGELHEAIVTVRRGEARSAASVDEPALLERYRWVY